MKHIKFFTIIPFVLLLMACSKKEMPILTYEQSLTPFTKSLTSFEPDIQNFRSRYFMPWQIKSLKIELDRAKWANYVFHKKNYYAENMKLWDEEDVAKILENTNFQEFNTQNLYAITSKEVQIRNLPTLRPFFKDPKLAGEGYGFDYLQNTRLHVNEPLFISHYSKDRAWAFVQTPVSMGWIEVNSFSLVNAKEQSEFFKAPLLVITKDNQPLYDTDGKYLLHVKLGTLFPLVSEDETSFATYFFNNKQQTLKIDKTFANSFPLAFDEENILLVGNQLLMEKYGWGGFMNNRDCSAMTKDFFQSFGAWLPRNSFGQSKSGEYLALENLSNEEKEKIIAQFGVPFQSLLYLKGHIMLYIGESSENKAMVMHNTWGLKIENDKGEEERKIIGEAIVSDLYLGANQENIIEKSLLINQLKGLVIKPINTQFPTNPLTKAYPSVVKIEKNLVYFEDNTTMPYDDGEEKNFEAKLQNADIEDMLSEPYSAFAPLLPPTNDAGRYRNEDFFKKLYGQNQEEIKANLTQIAWLDGKMLYFNQKQNAALQLQKVIEELKKLPPQFAPFITNIAGTYNHRTIAGTTRLSAHSFGIAIDLNVKKSSYWKWDKSYNFRNSYPKEIIDIFERYGFIWGGRWYHYDTMHFEYRPELFFNID